ncbi:MAG: multidrug effflux MFS transporter [Bacteroidales bacterium]|nr:multidrug effflux MFS transporter [Bacteroidales bacterium]
MKSFTLIQWIIIIILSLLTALEPLSIDMYLPAFIPISKTFGTTLAAVQLSLTAFLGGFAIGQLFWGPLADKFGRKKPILISLGIFIAASIACIYVKTIEQLWVMRFIQALGGCGGVVISRAVVTDYFEPSKTLKIFTLLALIMSIAPIVGPLIGNAILTPFNWEGIFWVMVFLGIGLVLLTLFFLPETYKRVNRKPVGNVFNNYIHILKIKKFTFYALVAGVANGALMVYVGNAPYLIMEYGQLSGNTFSIIFAINALGLMIASYLTNVFQKYTTTQRLVKYALTVMSVTSILLMIAIFIHSNIYIILSILFVFIFPIGILFPATTELAMKPFTDNSGSASALFGSIQLLVAFFCTIIASLINDGSVVSVGVAYFICGLMAFFSILPKIKDDIREYKYR